MTDSQRAIQALEATDFLRYVVELIKARSLSIVHSKEIQIACHGKPVSKNICVVTHIATPTTHSEM